MATVFVSGAGGFLASHTVALLLSGGHRVRGSVRSLTNTRSFEHLRQLPGAADRLELVEANLLASDAFAGLLDGCDAVMHIASPYAIDVADPQRELIDPAVRGTRSMLAACERVAGLSRVVVTSSIAAITDQPEANRVFDEDDWNTKSTPGRNPYYLSKTLAEREAWAFVDARAPAWDLVVLNPSIVIGPSMSKALNTSNGIFASLLNGAYPGIFSLTWPLVDVRDVAEAHVRAMDAREARGRYICSAESVSARRVVGFLRANGYDRYRLPAIGLDNPVGNVVVKLASRFQPKGVGQYLRTHVGPPLRFDTTKIRRDLRMAFRPVEESLLDMAADLVRWGHVTPRR